MITGIETRPQLVAEKCMHGFALVVTLILMVLLTIIALGLLSLSSVSLRTSSENEPMLVAQANARMALMLAVGQLQRAAGPDQRITATAAILGDSNNDYTKGVTPSAGRAAWTGVWKTDTVAVPPDRTANYNPVTPNQRAFVGWLASSPTPGTAPNLGDAAASSTDEVVIFKGVDSARVVKVPKVAVKDGSGKPGAYAYWVEDEGVKADLGWHEGTFSNNEQEQAVRLSVTPGPDYEVFGGPFRDKVSHPLQQGGNWLDDMDKALSTADMPLVLNAPGDPEWLKDKRHDITLGSLGVLADVKLGGLRRDLSLAFEMDGKADISASEQPGKFNGQTEFAGGSDRFTSPKNAPGMPVKERYLWREMKNSGTPFSKDIMRDDSVMRGPTWWMLRDYANIYKRLRKSGANYSMDARARYPNTSAGGDVYRTIFPADVAVYNVWDFEVETKNSRYIYQPATANYAPAYLGSVVLLSAVPKEGKLALALDHVFYFWNPYNRKIRFRNLAVVGPIYSYPGTVTLWVTKNNGVVETEKKLGPALLSKYLDENAGGSGTPGITHLLRDLNGPITMEPGEVIIFSSDPASTQGSVPVNRNSASPGLQNKNVSDTGTIMTILPTETVEIPVMNTATSSWGEVPFDPASDKVRFNYVQYGLWWVGAERFTAITGLPGIGVSNAGQLSPENYGEELQYSCHNTANTTYRGWKNYVSPSAMSNMMNTPVNGMPPVYLPEKRFFGLFANLRKPADFGMDPMGSPIDAVPLESMTLFNPLAPLYGVDVWHTTHPNSLFMTVSSTNSNELYNNYGINFPRGNNGNWGAAYTSAGSTHVPMLDIPSSPLTSLAAFSHANLGLIGADPMRMVGNSRTSPWVNPDSVYDEVRLPDNNEVTCQDNSWLANDALFDRYYLSGIASSYNIGASGYNATGSLSDTLAKFYSVDFREAQVNPVLLPVIPPGIEPTRIVSELSADDGYAKLGAYSLVNGAFNVNSTSQEAWEAFLRGNRDLAVVYANGTSQSSSGAPFPSGTAPSAPGGGSKPYWSGFSRLDDAQISALAAAIVIQVRLRAPFMSLSDFVNHRVGTPVKNETHYAGVLQAAIDLSGINQSVRSGSGGVAPKYPTSPDPAGKADEQFYQKGVPPDLGGRTTASGIPAEINQADLLLPLAPRLTARSDTFRIRGYGEARSADGTRVIARATCEAVVQRMPEYMDPVTDPDNNKPWSEVWGNNNTPWSTPRPTASSLNKINQLFGRRFKVMKFRWLAPAEI